MVHTATSRGNVHLTAITVSAE